MKKSIVYLYEDTYTDNFDGYLIVYSPFSRKGLTLLNQSSAFLFGLINNNRSLWDIYQIAKKIDINLSFSTIKKIFNDFERSEIVHLNTPPKIFFNDPKPKQLVVWLHITNQCNLRCRYCFVQKTPEKMSEEIAKKAIQRILGESKKNKYDEIKIYFSGGECLLELKKIISIVQFARNIAKKIGIKINFAIATNGVLITPSIVQILKENNIEVGISIDGLGKHNDAQRIFPNGTGTFKHIEQGINNLRAGGVDFNATVTITNYNIEGLPQLTKYFLENNIPFRFNFYRNIPYTREGLKTQADNTKIIKFLRKSYKLILDALPQHNLISDILDTVNFRKGRLNACAVGNNYITITHKGKLASCPMTINHPFGTISDKNIIGSIKKGSFIRPGGLTVNQKKGCLSCRWKYICGGGCPLLTFGYKKTYQSNSPYCEVYKSLIPEALKLEAGRLIKYGVKKTD